MRCAAPLRSAAICARRCFCSCSGVRAARGAETGRALGALRPGVPGAADVAAADEPSEDGVLPVAVGGLLPGAVGGRSDDAVGGRSEAVDGGRAEELLGRADVGRICPELILQLCSTHERAQQWCHKLATHLSNCNLSFNCTKKQKGEKLL